MRRISPQGQKLDLVTLTVDMAHETVAFGLIDDTSGTPRFHSAMNFVFPAGYLETSDSGQVGRACEYRAVHTSVSYT